MRFQIRLTPEELATIERSAEEKPLTWARKVLLAAAKRKA